MSQPKPNKVYEYQWKGRKGYVEETMGRYAAYAVEGRSSKLLCRGDWSKCRERVETWVESLATDTQ